MKKKNSLVGFFDRHYVLKETIIATLFTLAITLALSFVGLKFKFVRVIRQEFKGFDIYDLYYSNRGAENAKRDSNIIIVEIADDRESIARQIELIEKYSPSVIGVDAYFARRDDGFGSLRLLETVNKHNNIVVGSVYSDPPGDIIPNYLDEFRRGYASGYCNFVGTRYSVIRHYPPFLKIRDSLYPSFTSAIVQKHSPEKLARLKDRNNNKEIINYSGNIGNYTAFTREQLVEADSTGQLEGRFLNRIVLLGYFVKPGQPPVINDLYFSPVNEKISGKSYPDMYGVVIHANILSMILGENYASQAPQIISYLAAALIIFFFIYYMLSRYRKKPDPRRGIFLLIQFVLILLVLYGFLQLFNLFLIKTSLLPVLIAIVLCVEFLLIYKRIALWLHKKYGYKTVFAHKHIV